MEDRSRGRSNTEPVGDQRQALPIVQIEEFNGCLLCDSLPPEIAPKLSTVRPGTAIGWYAVRNCSFSRIRPALMRV